MSQARRPCPWIVNTRGLRPQVDQAKPGDRIAVAGVFKAVPPKAAGTMSGNFKAVLVANHVRQLTADASLGVHTDGGPRPSLHFDSLAARLPGQNLQQLESKLPALSPIVSCGAWKAPTAYIQVTCVRCQLAQVVRSCQTCSVESRNDESMPARLANSGHAGDQGAGAGAHLPGSAGRQPCAQHLRVHIRSTFWSTTRMNHRRDCSHVELGPTRGVVRELGWCSISVCSKEPHICMAQAHRHQTCSCAAAAGRPRAQPCQWLPPAWRHQLPGAPIV